MSFAPVYDDRSRALILGTWPSPKSREMAFYYGHPQNRFWPLLAALPGEPLPVREDGLAALIEELWFDGPKAEPSDRSFGSAWETRER